MTEKNEQPIVPEQRQGASKDIEHTESSVDESDARKLFLIARNRLVNVNQWHQYCDGMSAVFRLTDRHGNEVARTAQKDDFFKIDVPAPGPLESKGFDWVRVEAVEDKSNPDGTFERMALRVRPATEPGKTGENVSHFFAETSTSSFVIERRGNRVTAAVYGRNESPNTQTDNLVDKLRNALVGTGALAGLANIQWKNLVEGLVRPQ